MKISSKFYGHFVFLIVLPIHFIKQSNCVWAKLIPFFVNCLFFYTNVWTIFSVINVKIKSNYNKNWWVFGFLFRNPYGFFFFKYLMTLHTKFVCFYFFVVVKHYTIFGLDAIPLFIFIFFSFLINIDFAIYKIKLKSVPLWSSLCVWIIEYIFGMLHQNVAFGAYAKWPMFWTKSSYKL